MDSTKQTEFVRLAKTVVLKRTKQEESIEMNRKEFERLIKRIERLKRPPDWLRSIAFTSVGVFVSLLIAGLAEDSQSTWRVGYFIASIASLIICIALFIADFQLCLLYTSPSPRDPH